MLYLAYGSNLNKRQMAHRCPTAKFICTSVLEGYELLFRGGHGSAVANIEPKKDNSVPVGIWEIADRDEKALDIYEGYPQLYRKESVKVKVNGKKQEVMVYIMNEGKPLNAPSLYYYNVIEEGYCDCDINTLALEEALSETLRRA